MFTFQGLYFYFPPILCFIFKQQQTGDHPGEESRGPVSPSEAVSAHKGISLIPGKLVRVGWDYYSLDVVVDHFVH